MPEANRNLLAMVAWVGFDQRTIYFEQLPRPYGTSKWTSRKKTKLVVDSFVQFSDAPIRLISTTGLAAACSARPPAHRPGRRSRWLHFPVGLTVIAGLVVGFGGGVLGAIGIVGEYVWRAGYDARSAPDARRESGVPGGRLLDEDSGTGRALGRGARVGGGARRARVRLAVGGRTGLSGVRGRPRRCFGRWALRWPRRTAGPRCIWPC